MVTELKQNTPDGERLFVEWILANPEGFILNCTDIKRARDDWRIHRAKCPSMRYNPANKSGHNFTTKEFYKVVSSNKEELQAWALRERGKPVPECGTCSRSKK